ncbi:MAG: lysylphosphatidylglycerol synthase transmembrane domain-containing protein [Dehalococcoidia bacterium]
MNYLLKTIIGLVITVFFMAIFFYTAGLEEVFSTITNVKLIFLLPSIFLYFISLFIRTLRWQYILDSVLKIRTWTLFKSIAIGYSTNNILPVRLGELIRLYYVAKISNISKSTTLGTIITERVMDALTLIACVAFTLIGFILIDIIEFNKLFTIENIIIVTLIFGSLTILVIFFILIWLAKDPKIIEIIIKSIFARLSQTNLDKIINIYNYFLKGLVVLGSLKKISYIFFISLAIWIFEFFLAYILVISLGIENFKYEPVILFFILCLSISVANLATSIPLTQGGIGPFELSGSLILIMFGIDAAYAGAFIILLHALLLIPVTLVGMIFLFTGEESFFEVMRNSSKLRNNE